MPPKVPRLAHPQCRGCGNFHNPTVQCWPRCRSCNKLHRPNLRSCPAISETAKAQRKTSSAAMAMTITSGITNGRAIASDPMSLRSEQLLAQFMQRQHEETLKHLERQSKERQEFLNSLGIATPSILHSHSTTSINTTDLKKSEFPTHGPYATPAILSSKEANLREHQIKTSSPAASGKFSKTKYKRHRRNRNVEVENSPDDAESSGTAKVGMTEAYQTSDDANCNDNFQPLTRSEDDFPADLDSDITSHSPSRINVLNDTGKSARAAQSEDTHDDFEAVTNDQDYGVMTVEKSVTPASQNLGPSRVELSGAVDKRGNKENDQIGWNLYQQVKAEINLEYLFKAAATVINIKRCLERSRLMEPQKYSRAELIALYSCSSFSSVEVEREIMSSEKLVDCSIQDRMRGPEPEVDLIEF